MSITSYIANAYLENWIMHFWEKVEKTDSCWLWKGSKNKHGYGRVTVLHSQGAFVAHRVAYEIVTGEILDKDTVLLHKCDNPSCVNPAHLIPGTQGDNVRDCVAKGRFKNPSRGRRGETNFFVKLTEKQVRAIIEDRATGMSYAKLAERHNISKSQVARICSRQAWIHIQP